MYISALIFVNGKYLSLHFSQTWVFIYNYYSVALRNALVYFVRIIITAEQIELMLSLYSLSIFIEKVIRVTRGESTNKL